MNSVQSINTIELLNTSIDAIHIIYASIFRLMKPIRRKYKLSVNCLLVLNGCYLFHKYNGSLFSLHGLYFWVKYYNRIRLQYYLNYLIGKGYLIQSDIIKNIKYYRLTESGINVMNEFNSSYQEELSKFITDHHISI